MKTEDLIGALALDAETPTAPLGRGFVLAGVVGAVLSAALFFATIGPRPDFAVAVTTPRFVLKFVECAALAAAAGHLALALLRPAGDPATGRRAVIAVVAALAFAVAIEAFVVPSAEWGARVVGTNWFHCLTLVPLLAMPAIAVLLAAARRGAPSEPTRAGAAVGLLAGAIGAFFYAANCTDDSPLFVAVWYTLAISATAAIGAAIGRRLLAW